MKKNGCRKCHLKHVWNWCLYVCLTLETLTVAAPRERSDVTQPQVLSPGNREWKSPELISIVIFVLFSVKNTDIVLRLLFLIYFEFLESKFTFELTSASDPLTELIKESFQTFNTSGSNDTLQSVCKSSEKMWKWAARLATRVSRCKCVNRAWSLRWQRLHS